MFIRTRHFFLLLGLCALSASAVSADKASLERGRQIALKVCSACHVVATVQEYPPLLNPPAPPFAEIANRANMTRASLRHFITSTHWDEKAVPLTMPNAELLDSQVTDVVTYILSLPSQ
jgi:mono/diheme cytochrome c family protein